MDTVHVYKGNYRGARRLDDQPVQFITPLLDDIAVNGRYLPHKLIANVNKSFQGSIVLGMGFVLEPEEALALIDKDPRNRDVLFPYLNAEDLNDQPDQSPTRWVINFFDWTEEQARQYPDCYAIVQKKVYPERMKQNREIRQRYWWRFGETAPRLYRTIANMRRVLVVARVTKDIYFEFVNVGIVFNEKLIIFPFSEAKWLSLMQSEIHHTWAWQFSSTMKSDGLNYAPSDAFETFPFPSTEALSSLEDIGETYHETRRQIMLNRQEGLTATYNRFHNPDEHSADIQHLRDLHRQMDEAVAAAYGWDDLELEHDFHETAQGIRYTISEAARREVLKRLLALNFERYEEEQRLGVGVAGKKGKRKPHPLAPSPSSGEGGASGGDDGDPNAMPPEQQTLWDDDEPKQKRLL